MSDAGSLIGAIAGVTIAAAALVSVIEGPIAAIWIAISALSLAQLATADRIGGGA